MTPTELKNELSQFTGTAGYTRYSPALFPNVLLTDGAKFLAEAAGAYWLMDVVASHLSSLVEGESFVIAHLRTYMGEHGRSAYFTLSRDLDEDEPIEVYAQQAVDYTDFPLDEVTLYVARDDAKTWIVLLPSEY